MGFFKDDGSPEADEIIRTRLEKCLNNPDPKTGVSHTFFFTEGDDRTCPRCGINRRFTAERENEEETLGYPENRFYIVRTRWTNIRLI